MPRYLPLAVLVCLVADSVSADLITSIDANGIYNDNGTFRLQGELIVAGADHWAGNVRHNEATAALEFDLSSVSSGSHVLELFDTGSTSFPAAEQHFEVFGYVGDGSISVSDRFNVTNSVAIFTSSTTNFPFQPPQYFLDVSAFINQRKSAGDQFAGFHITPVDDGAFDGFGGSGRLNSTASVPEPSAVALLLLGLGFAPTIRRRRTA